MKRRTFLGFLGGAAVAGPQAAKSAAEMTLADLHAPGVSLNATMGGIGAEPKEDYGHSAKEYAKDKLKKLLGRSAKQVALERRTKWLDGLDPEVAGLRSVTLPNKIRMSRERAYDRAMRADRDTLLGRIEGWLE
jgi:hypothetical protein